MFVFVVIDGSLAWSPSSRRAWIEIVNLQRGFRQTEVALLAEGVDRNLSRLINSRVKSKVALLAEGVDRNRKRGYCGARRIRVALLAEGVDRNKAQSCAHVSPFTVALLAEGVDRNIADAKRQDVTLDRRPPRGGRG